MQDVWKAEKDILHVIASCVYLFSNLYLHYRHNPVAKELYKEIVAEVGNEGDTDKKTVPRTAQCHKNWSHRNMVGSYHIDDYESTTQSPRCCYMEQREKSCQVIDICIPLDTNINYGTEQNEITTYHS